MTVTNIGADATITSALAALPINTMNTAIIGQKRASFAQNVIENYQIWLVLLDKKDITYPPLLVK